MIIIIKKYFNRLLNVMSTHSDVIVCPPYDCNVQCIYNPYIHCPDPIAGALSNDTCLTSVCCVHRAYIENREAYED